MTTVAQAVDKARFHQSRTRRFIETFAVGFIAAAVVGIPFGLLAGPRAGATIALVCIMQGFGTAYGEWNALRRVEAAS